MQGREWFINVAVTFDGKISLDNQPLELSSYQDWRIVHRLRNSSAAIIVGSNTVLNDNPNLLVKQEYLPDDVIQHPIRIIFDRRGRIDGSFNVFQDQHLARTLWITNSQKNIDEIKKIEYQDIQAVVNQVNQFLSEEDRVGPVMIEGGGELISSFIDSNLISFIRVYRNPMIVPEGKPLFSRSLENQVELTSINRLGSGLEEYYKIIQK